MNFSRKWEWISPQIPHRRCLKWQKVEGYIKLQIPAGKATPAPPVGPALGQHGVNIVQFTKEFNARTADQGDMDYSLSSLFTLTEVHSFL